MKEVEIYKLDIVELTFTHTLGTGSQLFERDWTLLFWSSIALSRAMLASASPMASIKVLNDSYQRGHGIGSSPGRGRKGGKGANGSSILIANVMPNNTQTTAVSSQGLLHIRSHYIDNSHIYPPPFKGVLTYWNKQNINSSLNKCSLTG